LLSMCCITYFGGRKYIKNEMVSKMKAHKIKFLAHFSSLKKYESLCDYHAVYVCLDALFQLLTRSKDFAELGLNFTTLQSIVIWRNAHTCEMRGDIKLT
jgi:hypothetical protein